MKGTTHLAIGAAIGIASASLNPFTLTNAAIYIAVAGFSALAADLDGPSMLSSKLDKASRMFQQWTTTAGVILAVVVGLQYVLNGQLYWKFAAVSVMILLLGLVVREGVLRNSLVSLVGCGLLYAGFTMQMHWLAGFGLFIAWVPWLKHRGLSHTVWAILAWAAISTGLERQLGIPGLMNTAVAGYVSHLAADTLTPKGVKWLYPLVGRSFKV
ncbi:metal-dependent hydrolase [Paenibacillus gansuensis]|uniref:Metal-dependent hydrolase n=1 Tax=Paenibacillus gansuensis TaxID=306542 RepID=A0ABW5PJI6_9BACL